MGLREDILNRPCSSLPRGKLLTVPLSMSVRDVVRRMVDEDMGCAFVVDGDHKPQGKFTERELIKLLSDGKPFWDDPIEKYTAQYWACIRHDEAIAMVIHKMRHHGLHHVCVVDDAGRAVAHIGQRGVMEFLAEHFPRAVKSQLMETKLHMDQREGA
jgi:predicted transcriptional regulator